MRLPFTSARSRLKRAFVACDARKAAGLGWEMKSNGELAEMFNRLAEAELALQGSQGSEVTLSRLELELLGSYDSLNSFFSEPPSAGRLWKQVESVVPRFAVTVAAAALLVLLSPGSSVRNYGMLERGTTPVSFVRPYCVPPLGHRGEQVRDALFTGNDAECFSDEMLVLGYRLATARPGGWFHAYALAADGTPVWITPNPAAPLPPLLKQQGQVLGQAWHPIRLAVNYKPGSYQIHWFICDRPMGFDWLEKALNDGGLAPEDLPLPAQGCELGSFSLFVEEVAQ